MPLIQLKEGLKLKLIQGDQNFYREGLHSKCGEWIAGAIPVGTVGTVYKAQLKAKDSWMYALQFEGITPKEGYVFGLGRDTVPDDKFEIVP